MKKLLLLLVCACMAGAALAKDFTGIVADSPSAPGIALIADGQPARIVIAADELKGVRIAANNLAADFERVCGTKAQIANQLSDASGPEIIVGTITSPLIKKCLTAAQLKSLKGKWEQYLIVADGNRVVIAGSDMRGAIYGIYELSEQIGVSPWYDWADVPAEQHKNLTIKTGEYTAGEPAVK